ncbi:MAG: hypothetical protein EXR95_06790 [Gemmatimonadetes bacterium]|nr:hypothetical protein [Gemmatimonadota bacterium]
MLRSSSPASLLSAVLLWCAGAAAEARAQVVSETGQRIPASGPENVARCEPLLKMMRETLEMAAEISPDTVNDWRTGRILPGCRVTAVGSMRRENPGEENEVFYYTLLGAGWERTPDPRDRPQEAAIMLRHEGADCFFTPYSGIRLATEAEFRINQAFTTRPGEFRYSFLARCVEALPADPR